jgi:septal ring factor EnvC (AmiA/AmiB activator)
MAADDKHSPTAVAALAEVIEQRQAKSPELAAKQARLLDVLARGPAATDDHTRPETEADGLRAGELRRLKAERYSESLRRQASDRTRSRGKGDGE